MKKFKNWLRVKLIRFLGIDTLINLFDKHIDKNDTSFCELRKLIYDLNHSTKKDLKNDISHFQESVNTLHRTIENVVHIGTDVKFNEREHNWAVVCIEGKINIVKFIELDRNNAKDMLHILKQFEGGRHCIDTPYKEIFYDGLFKF